MLIWYVLFPCLYVPTLTYYTFLHFFIITIMDFLYRKIVETRSCHRVESMMTDSKRAPKLGHTLTGFKNIIMTRSARVRDIYLISAKQKYNQHGTAAIEPEVLEQNNSNLLKEKHQYDIFRAKSAGGRIDKKPTELNNNRTSATATMGMKMSKNAKGDSKTLDRSSSNADKKYVKQKQSKENCKKFSQSDTTVFKRFIKGDLARSNKDDTRAADKEENTPVAPVKVKPNIYETVPRGPVRSNTAISLENSEMVIKKNTELLQRTESRRRSKPIPRGGDERQNPPVMDRNHRPQTPKIKKSGEMRNNKKLLTIADNAGEMNKNMRTEPQVLSTEVGTRPSRTQSRRRRQESARLELPEQLLHPLWRRIPHRVLYGWSEQHQLLETLLHNQIADNEIACLYYTTDEAYTHAQTTSGTRFLSKPIVESASEVLSLLDYYELCPGALPKPSPVDSPLRKCSKRWDSGVGEGGSSEDVESGYDADDE